MSKTFEDRAREDFRLINKAEYECALAESQVDEQWFGRVKRCIDIAENAFVQGSINQRAIDIDKACAWLTEHAQFTKRGEIWGFDVESFRKAMEST